jgi:UDP-N-acetylglucosamine 4-epimerase
VADAEPVHCASRPGDIPHSQASIDKIQRRLGYRHTHELGDGLRETVSWFGRWLAGHTPP